MRRRFAAVVVAGAISGVVASGWCEAPASLDLLEARSAGEATTSVQSRIAFTQHAPGLGADELLAFALGNRIFRTSWVEAPASVGLFDGLGPFFSSRSCSGCHVRDGRGRPPEGPDDRSTPILTRLGSADASGRRVPDPHYGSQLSERAVQGLAPEGRLVVRWEEVEHLYPSGERAMLRRPRFAVEDTAYGPLAAGVRVSVRIAPAVIGGGLLESIPDSALASLEDPEDRDRDGISGRVHWLESSPSGTASPVRVPGRFGWKASQRSLAAQVSAALAGDLGVTTPSTRDLDVTDAQVAARRRDLGGEPELEGRALAALLDYCRLVAVPARRGLDDPAVRRGAERFRSLGCASCHVPTLVTGDAPVRAMARQRIHPYTDLLLHDMGPALSDGLPEGDARASEWRTPPLWGLGLARVVTGHLFLMHDGRARSHEEAILWHDGEARASRDGFRALPAAARDDLIRYLESL